MIAPRGVRPVARDGARWALWLAIAVLAIYAGLAVRQWTFETTRAIRFRGDVDNAARIGRRVMMNAVRRDLMMPPAAQRPPGPAPRPAVPTWPKLMASYLDAYDAEYSRAGGNPTINDSAFRIDYPPGRLLVMSAWVRHAAGREGLLVRYSDDNVGPLLRFNTAHELLAAAGLFALVRRAQLNAGVAAWRAEALGGITALLAWFNPALLLNAHGWPQWDAWVLPYTIWAAYFGLVDRWLLVGALLGAGALFKGQVLLIAPLFALWPLFQMRLDAVARLAAGLAATVAVAASPWLLGRAEAGGVTWALGAVALAAVTLAWPWRRSGGAAWWATGVVLVVWLATAAARAGAASLPWLVLAGLGVLLAPAVWRGRRRAAFCAFAGLTIFAAGAWFGGSFAWFAVGFQTDRFPVLSVGNTANVGSILANVYKLRAEMPVTLPWFGGAPLDLRTLLRGLAYVGVAASALGVALAQRRRDANVVVGFAAAWTVLYALMPQMHERYLLWACVTSAVLATRSAGGLLAHVALTLIQTAMILASMIESGGMTADPALAGWYAAMKGLTPGAGYATLTIALALVVWSCQRDATRTASVRRAAGDVSGTAGAAPATA